ncbi:MAG: UDP-3-O-[3-hydroxymyristoyl] N-acetylglucosamine deacetylase [Planctomycetes bacterium]|nr:UDP-3-O-[3-hydroxymyristoyl] N-acetylglucosamine deacetylase [Planctomycetota bacterium]NOG55264.1 UDP-3-O-[3-hydroxymyristoyl] N-acetylglucosamine deacetylase [Planctomycetota bacterium]
MIEAEEHHAGITPDGPTGSAPSSPVRADTEQGGHANPAAPTAEAADSDSNAPEASAPIKVTTRSMTRSNESGDDNNAGSGSEKQKPMATKETSNDPAPGTSSDGPSPLADAEAESGATGTSPLASADRTAAKDPNVPMQRTLSAAAEIEGRGLFLGEPVTCVILPAPPDHGIVFERTDLDEPVRIPAFVANVIDRARRSTLRVGEGSVETCEHCLSALAGLGVDNALIKLTGPELPCGDGSAMPFVDAILAAGIVDQDAERRVHRITQPITVQDGDSMLAALPSDSPDLQILYDLDYGQPSPLARQLHSFRLTSESYIEQIAPARTFSLQAEAQALWDRGMCQHLTPRDVLVIGDDGPIDNAFRFDSEPVRHKILDLIGDLYLLGRQVQGRIVAYKSGHALNHTLVNKLLEQIRVRERTDIAGRRPQMDIRRILSLLRHRYPMLLVDRVIEIEGDRRAIGVKNVTINEPFFQGHYPGAPIMPGVLIVEALAQLAGLLVSNVLEHKGKIPILLSMDRVKLRRPVVPGDQLVLEAETIRAQGRMANVMCKAFVAGDLAAEAQVKFLLVDEEQD